jgi:hypothetical protein
VAPRALAPPKMWSVSVRAATRIWFAPHVRPTGSCATHNRRSCGARPQRGVAPPGIGRRRSSAPTKTPMASHRSLEALPTAEGSRGALVPRRPACRWKARVALRARSRRPKAAPGRSMMVVGTGGSVGSCAGDAVVVGIRARATIQGHPLRRRSHRTGGRPCRSCRQSRAQSSPLSLRRC